MRGPMNGRMNHCEASVELSMDVRKRMMSYLHYLHYLHLNRGVCYGSETRWQDGSAAEFSRQGHRVDGAGGLWRSGVANDGRLCTEC